MLTNQTVATLDTGIGFGAAPSFPPDQRGHYEVLVGGRIRLSFDDGSASVRTFAVLVTASGPDPTDATGDGGVVMDDLNFWREDDN